ncbi:MAG: hypothetical protein A3F31_04640 [Candidatus Levybacteria bacterium RIFCSPHIGHO2_12_FULL_38_12]|nr:MAG: hypothetical protein A2770_04325 [Candidatus Levybacteria bacterium RIFCSPHIGHO2_01_FULL_38_12]OGH21802.1 MAG: hypothetical protein A3D75_01265 [Candidatus Levybacteria bacterium RIFCSPHIGHO2_02_FULL_37_18]OGH22541.1 MAG: hypothetical protein A3F31_04640 [Candidatus Levybacteria bacterium RIFCSPHIGHO2_12_FULL_38_12]OGH33423.1 MAG: hypothetical protein A3A47_04215 [Candidatus Levybacteria bacterium RIFCSPLOWO2_01_FULL_37_20]OGH44078.1 MAG: hypothetical protein A3J14_05010 [Candidatus Lev
MNKLFFDIETLPAAKEVHVVLQEIYDKRKNDGKKVKEFIEFVEDTSFDGAFGRICCISYGINDDTLKTICGEEKEMLIEFWKIAKNIDLFVGFNIIDFDMRFILQRSVIWGVKPTKELSFARYRSFPMFDLMYEWSKWNTQDKISLDTLAKALGLPSSKGGTIEGKDVAKAYEEGRIKEICYYCEKDVELTRKIYKKVAFEDSPEEDIPF